MKDVDVIENYVGQLIILQIYQLKK